MSSSIASVGSLPHWWRVTRYDPAYRDERGRYVRETWISIGQVGETFDGVRLTREEYEATEDCYVTAVRAFAAEAGVAVLEVRALETRGAAVADGDRLSMDEAGELIRALLRGEIDCKLESPADDFAVHVGYDLYMYVGAAVPCPKAEARIGCWSRVFAERWPGSPQLPDDQ